MSLHPNEGDDRHQPQRLLYKTLSENIKFYNTSSDQTFRREMLLKSHRNFLSEMKINANLEIYNYWDVSMECIALAFQFTCCCMFCLIFFLIYEEEPSAKFQNIEVIFLLLNLLMILPFLYFNRFKESTKSSQQNSIISTIFNWTIVVLILLGVSPILRTLTLLYSQDTIIALVCLLFITHLFTHDYYFVNGKTEKYNCYLSLNCEF